MDREESERDRDIGRLDSACMGSWSDRAHGRVRRVSTTRAGSHRWLVIAKGYHGAQLVILLVVTAACLRWVPERFVLPRFMAGLPIAAPTLLLACYLVAVAALTTVPEPAPALAQTSPRDWARTRVRRIAVVTWVSWVAVAAGMPTEAAVASSVLPTLVGEGLLLGAFNARLAWLSPTAHLGAAMALGTSPVGDVSWWAWIIEPNQDLNDILLGLAIFSTGAAAWGRSRNAAQ